LLHASAVVARVAPAAVVAKGGEVGRTAERQLKDERRVIIVKVVGVDLLLARLLIADDELRLNEHFGQQRGLDLKRALRVRELAGRQQRHLADVEVAATDQRAQRQLLTQARVLAAR
jgi:hypothetical protein